MSLTLKTLGRLEIEWDGQAVPELRLRKSQALLIYLALNPGCHDRSRLAGLLWGDLPEENARRNLRHALYRLRQTLGPEILSGGRLTIGLNPDVAVQADATDFEAAIAGAARCRRAGEPAAVADHLERAVTLYDGDFLAGFDVADCREFEEWVAARQARLREQVLEALDELATHWTRHGAHERALRYARRLLALEPLWERSHRQTMTLLALTGQRSAALIQYEACRRLLEAELGVAPLEETTALYERIRESEALGNREIGARDVPAPPVPDSPISSLPFVGREEEHAALVAWWAAAQRGEGQLTLVEGEAGVGKTRLLEEVVRYAAVQGAVILGGRCYEFGGGLPYQPIAEALRGYLDAEEERVFPRSAPSLSAAWLAELARLLPDLHLAFPDLPEAQRIAGEAARQRLFEAVARFLRAACPPQSSLCLFLDDLHWADPSTLDLLHYLSRRLAQAPVWLVGAYRPEEVGLGHPLTRLRQGLSRDGRLAHLALDRLSDESVRGLARTLVSEKEGGPWGDLFYRESEGNPFILSEIVSSLRERELLSGAAASLEPWQSLSPAERLPPRVQDVILQRVGRLSELSRRLLRLAATAGRPFEPLLLETAAGLDAAQVDECLGQWLARRLVNPVSSRRRSSSSPTGSPVVGYDFTHDKIRAAVYRALSPPEQQRLHRTMGEALEIVHREDLAPVYEALAYHFERAGAVDKALAYLPLAAAKAAAVYANEEALDYYRRALALCSPTGERRWPLLLQQADVFCLVGRYEAAIAACEEVIEGSESDWQSRAYSRLAHVYRIHRDYASARRWAQKSERLARAAEPADDAQATGERARALQTLGEIEREQSNLARAQELFEAALARYRQIDDATGQANCFKGLGDALCAGGHHAQARQRYEQAVVIFQRVGDKQSASTCLRGIAAASWRQGNYDASRQATLESLEISRAIGDRQGEAAALNNLGLLVLVQGDHEQTQRHLEASVAIFRELGLEKRTASGLHNLGISYSECGKLASARRCLEQALDIDQAAGARRDQALDLGWLGVVHWRLGDLVAASHHLDRALALDEEIGGSEEEDWHLLWRAAVACESGELPAARHYLRGAKTKVSQGRTNVKAYDLTHWEACIYLAEGDFEAARAAARQALAQAEAVGAAPSTLGSILRLLGRCLGSGPGADDEQARRHFDRALTLLPDAAPTSHARATVLHDYGAYLAHEGQSHQADTYRDEAQAILERLGDAD